VSRKITAPHESYMRDIMYKRYWRHAISRIHDAMSWICGSTYISYQTRIQVQR